MIHELAGKKMPVSRRMRWGTEHRLAPAELIATIGLLFTCRRMHKLELNVLVEFTPRSRNLLNVSRLKFQCSGYRERDVKKRAGNCSDVARSAADHIRQADTASYTLKLVEPKG